MTASIPIIYRALCAYDELARFTLVAALTGFCFVDLALVAQTMPQQFFGGINALSLMAIPLFVLTGNLLNVTGMIQRVMAVARCLVGHWRDGIGHVNVVSSIFFAGVNGLAVADTSALTLLAGIDPVHLGIVITLNITIALITPPMGACVYVAAAVSKIDILDLFKTIWPFVAVACVVLLLIIFFPDLTLWLPHLLQKTIE